MQYLCFDITYENGDQNGKNDYRVDPFLVNKQVDEIKYCFTNITFSLGILPVLPPKL